jgi:hypothetical protein
MAFLREGFTVTYIGEDVDGITLGDKGQLLAFANDHHSHAHVQWHTGARVGQITMTAVDDIDNASLKYQRHDDLADSLDVGPITLTGARQIYDSAGAEGTLIHLAAEGSLTGLATIADQALDWTCAKIRTEHSFMTAIATLEPDEQEEIIHMAACTALRDTYGSGNV